MGVNCWAGQNPYRVAAPSKKKAGFWCGDRKDVDNWENIDVCGRIILKWIVEK
jgi:hypothetical protein